MEKPIHSYVERNSIYEERWAIKDPSWFIATIRDKAVTKYSMVITFWKQIIVQHISKSDFCSLTST